MEINKEKVFEVAHDFMKGAVQKSPKLLMILGLGGFATTMFVAIANSKKADLLIDEAKAVKADEEGVDQSKRANIKLAPREKFGVFVKAYWPTAVMFGMSTAAVIAGEHISEKRQVALAGAYAIADVTLKEFQKKTVETIGKQKTDEIRSKVTEEKLRKNPPKEEVIKFATEYTQYTMFMAPMTNQPFIARYEDVENAFNRINHMINSGNEVTLNDLLYELNSIAIDTGRGRGVYESNVGTVFYWEACGEIVNWHPSAAIVPDTNIPCLEIILDTKPICCYDDRG